MTGIVRQLQQVPYVVVDGDDRPVAATNVRDLAVEEAARVNGRALTLCYGEIQEVHN